MLRRCGHGSLVVRRIVTNPSSAKAQDGSLERRTSGSGACCAEQAPPQTGPRRRLAQHTDFKVRSTRTTARGHLDPPSNCRGRKNSIVGTERTDAHNFLVEDDIIGKCSDIAEQGGAYSAHMREDAWTRHSTSNLRRLNPKVRTQLRIRRARLPVCNLSGICFWRIWGGICFWCIWRERL